MTTDRVAPEELVKSAAFIRGFIDGHPKNADRLHIAVNRLDRAAQHIARLEGDNERLRKEMGNAASAWEIEDARRILNLALSNSTKEGTDG